MEHITNKASRASQSLGLFIVLCLSFLAAGTEAQIEVDSETKLPEKKSFPKEIPVSVREQIAATLVDVALDSLDLTEVLEEDKVLSEQKGLRRIGIHRRLPTTVTVSAEQSSRGSWVNLRDGGSLWILTIQSPKAEAIRVHVEDLNLPKGVQFMIYNTDVPQESYGPYGIRYLQGRSEFWTASVFAPKITVECYIPPNVNAHRLRFQIREIVHVYMKLWDLLSRREGDCHNDVTCFPNWSVEASGVAGLGTIGNVGVLWCTGCLLNDFDSETYEDYFLTANHCLSGYSSILGTQADANTIEFYWFYQTPECDTFPPNPATVPRTGGGADLISAQTRVSGNDHAFLRIRNPTPGGVSYVGWTTGTPGSSDTLTGIHHPDGSFKRISFGTLDASSTNFWDVEWHSGVTEPGSSGSPLFDEDKRIIGQLWGGFSSCSNPTGIDNYGRFNITYPIIQRWLEIGGTIHVDGAYVGQELGTPSQPFNTVDEANDYAWDGARIKIQAGSFPETLTFSKQLTILAHGGTVTIGE